MKYKRSTKEKEFLSKKSKRKFITLSQKHELFSVNGFRINKNGKTI